MITKLKQVLLPDRIAEVWEPVSTGRRTRREAMQEQARLTAEYAVQWTDALKLEGCETLEESILTELADYYGRNDLGEVRALCQDLEEGITEAWVRDVDETDPASIDAFYDQVDVERYIHSLMWWHTLDFDESPLAYVLALEFAKEHGCKTLLDFGTGAGSGTILFAASGLAASGADISEPMLAFTDWRLKRRGLRADILDLRSRELPANTYDFVSAMDVFEHLSDPYAVVDDLARAIRPGGYLFGRFHVWNTDDNPLHIVRDFQPVFEHMADRGFERVWRDNWLWGHLAFVRR